MNAEFENTLTNQESISYLLSKEGEKMNGNIRAKGKCPVCQSKYTEIKRLGFVCPEHQTTPKRFYVDIYHKKQHKFYSDKYGKVLSAYENARDFLKHINTEIDLGSFDPANYIKAEQEKFYVSNLLKGFCDHKLSGDRIAPSYIWQYKYYTEIARNYFSTTDVRDIRKIHIVNYQAHLNEEHNWGNKTLKNCIDIFKTFLNYVKSDLEIINVVPHFPVIDIPLPETTWLSPKMQMAAFDCVPDIDKPIIAFLMLTGCRPGEARALKCKDINLQSRSITIFATFSGTVYRRKRKGKKSKPLPIPIHPEIFEYVRHRVENNLPEAFVFTSKSGDYYRETYLRCVWKNAKKDVGLPEALTLYEATRHSYANQLLDAGVALYKVSQLLGHSDIRTTEKSYIHRNFKALEAEISNISLKEKVTKLKKGLALD